jgi:hypothetical protein
MPDGLTPEQSPPILPTSCARERVASPTPPASPRAGRPVGAAASPAGNDADRSAAEWRERDVTPPPVVSGGWGLP